MKIVPIENITLISSLSKIEAIENLKSIVSPKESSIFRNSFTSNENEFHGEIKGDNFLVTRVINYRNSFLPQAHGKIVENLTGTEIQIVLKPIAFVKLFMVLWLSFVSFGFLASLVAVAIGEIPIAVCVVPLIMLFFGFGLFKSAFSYESKKTKKALIQVFKAKIKNGT